MKNIVIGVSSFFTLFWQLLVLFGCCLGVGLPLRFLLPKEFSLLSKVLFSLMGGLFLVVLIPQNLVYLGVPVRISAWLILAAALVQVWPCRQKVVAWIRAFYSSAEIRTLAAVILLTIIFHGIVPIRQSPEWYYGKAHEDQINYVLLAEFLKEEPYHTSEQGIGLRPWLVRPVGFRDTAEQLGLSPGPGLEMIGLKNERIGQSIITAEISVWSGTDAKAGYAGTVIFFLTLLAVCPYVLLRETGIDRFMAVSGALLAALLPAVTRLSLDGFLSQVSILFVFPLFASLLQRQELSSRSFTLYFSLTLAYLVAAYSELAPIGLCTLFLGVTFVRHDTFRSKCLMVVSAILLVALINPFYLRNLIAFLAQQYSQASNTALLDNLAPNLRTLRDWSELIFGTIASPPFALFFDCCALLLGLLVVAGYITLSRRDRLIYGTILLPAILVIVCLATWASHSSYTVAKIALTILPFVIGLVFAAVSRAAANSHHCSNKVLMRLLCAFIVAAAAAGSVRYYSEVLDSEGLLRYVREPRFQNVCRELNDIKNERVLVFETDMWLAPWLCYHARYNEVYYNGRFVSDSSTPHVDPLSVVPDLVNVDFVVTRDRIVDLRAPKVSCLSVVDDIPGEVRADGHTAYWVGPPAGLCFLALRPISVNLKMRLKPGPEATTLPIDYFLADDQGHVSQGEIRGETVDVRRMNFPAGFTRLQLSVRAKESDPNTGPSFPNLAELEDLELTEIDLHPGK